MKEAVIITGPTASGKSEAAILLAKQINGVIINADSIQIYQEIPILSAQPTKADLFTVPHLLYGNLTNAQAVKNPFNVSQWLRSLRIELDKLSETHLVPIIVGGTAMYIYSLIHGLSDLPKVSAQTSNRAEELYTTNGHEWLLNETKKLDPETPIDQHRLIRNYIYLLDFGKPMRQLYIPTQYQFSDYNFIKTILLPPRDQIYGTCNSRFHNMINNGALDEVEQLISANHEIDNISKAIMKASGFREIAKYLSGNITLETCIDQASKETRNYAKRQTTWMKNKFVNFNMFTSLQELVNFAYEKLCIEKIEKKLEKIEK